MRKMKLSDMFFVVSMSGIDNNLKHTLYEYIRDAIKYRHYISGRDLDTALTMDFFVNNTELFNTIIKNNSSMGWGQNIDYYAQMVVWAYNMHLNGDSVLQTPKRPIDITSLPTAPKKTLPPPQPSLQKPQKVKRVLNFDTSTSGFKQEIINKVEAFVNLMDDNASKHFIMFQMGNKLVSLRIFDK